jgi:glycosyltransferase involved in cell wall biosynthesis
MTSSPAGLAISIVTPTLNAETYLEQCLASVREQQVARLEHLVIDGGSTDRTAEIVLRQSRAAWIPRPGSTQSQAINEGLRRSSGDVVAWLNADDLYLPDVLPFVVERFERDPDLDVLYGDCQVIGPDREPLWWERPGRYDFRRILRRGNYIAQPAVFLRRMVFEAVGYLDESLEYGMDCDLWLRLRGRNVVYTQRPLACFRWHAQSKSARGQLQAWRELLRIVGRYGGGWTPELRWAYTRCLITIARVRLVHMITGSTSIRPLTRGTA